MTTATQQLNNINKGLNESLAAGTISRGYLERIVRMAKVMGKDEWRLTTSNIMIFQRSASSSFDVFATDGTMMIKTSMVLDSVFKRPNGGSIPWLIDSAMIKNIDRLLKDNKRTTQFMTRVQSYELGVNLIEIAAADNFASLGFVRLAIEAREGSNTFINYDILEKLLDFGETNVPVYSQDNKVSKARTVLQCSNVALPLSFNVEKLAVLGKAMSTEKGKSQLRLTPLIPVSLKYNDDNNEVIMTTSRMLVESLHDDTFQAVLCGVRDILQVKKGGN